MAKVVTIESLAQRIAELESRPRSLNEDFQLEAYRELQSLRFSYAELLERYDLDVNHEGK